jgi:hypothetical protein
MAGSQTTVHLVIALGACICAPATVLAQHYQYQRPGYNQYQTPGYTTGAPAIDTWGPTTAITPQLVPTVPAIPQPDPPAVPDATFRDRLLRLNSAAPATKTQPGFTTSDTTSSYSTSGAAGNTTRDTTSSYSTMPDPANGMLPNPAR